MRARAVRPRQVAAAQGPAVAPPGVEGPTPAAEAAVLRGHGSPPRPRPPPLPRLRPPQPPAAARTGTGGVRTAWARRYREVARGFGRGRDPDPPGSRRGCRRRSGSSAPFRAPWQNPPELQRSYCLRCPAPCMGFTGRTGGVVYTQTDRGRSESNAKVEASGCSHGGLSEGKTLRPKGGVRT